MRFVHGGITYSLSAEDVSRALRDVPPGTIQKHSVLVSGVRYPVRQAMAVATGLNASDFTSHAARRHLAALGLELSGEVEPRGPQFGIGRRSADEPPSGPVDPHQWPWEGAVQDVFISAIEAAGWTISSAADTATKAHGVDVLAAKDDRALGAEVKGWPSKGYADPRRAAEKKKTQPTVQAGHWYSQALMKAVMLLDSHPAADSLIVLPDYPRYRDLVRRTATGCARAGVHVVFVDEGGSLSSDTWAV